MSQKQNENNSNESRIEKKYNYFYKITNLINGKYYYGIHSTDNLDDGYMGGGTLVRRAQKKYGIENFKKEIIKQFSTRNELSDYEQKIVTIELIESEECYNVRTGGNSEQVYNNEHRIRRSLKNTELMRNKDLRNRISNTLKGRKISPEIIKKRVSSYTRCVKVIIDNVVFETLKSAVNKLNISAKIIKIRCLSNEPEWSEWKFINPDILVNNKKPMFKLSYYYEINGETFVHHDDIIEKYPNLNYFNIRYKCKSNLEKYKDWKMIYYDYS
jgi:hypothetical protein